LNLVFNIKKLSRLVNLFYPGKKQLATNLTNFTNTINLL
jgi:hypothetical protein